MKSLALAVGLLVGCSTVQVRSTPAPGVDLSQRRTFGFMTPAHTDAPGAELARLPAGQQIRDTITRDLIGKGYAPVAEGAAPDFLVAYHARTQQKTEVQDWGYGDPYWWGSGPDVTVRQYTEGTLFVDSVDPQTRQVIWRGTAQGVVNHPENPDLGKLSDAVTKLMNQYPPSTLASGGHA